MTKLMNYPSGDSEFDKWYEDHNPGCKDTLEYRVYTVYNQLVEETDNPITLHDRVKNQRLKDLLELFEYLRGEESDNPVKYWFEE